MGIRISAVLFAVGLFTPGASAQADPSKYFKIRVVDETTGRGIPMVELRTTANVRYCTDSAGRVAIREPGLMDRRVFFNARTPGYELPKRGWIRGFGVRLKEGGRRRWK